MNVGNLNYLVSYDIDKASVKRIEDALSKMRGLAKINLSSNPGDTKLLKNLQQAADLSAKVQSSLSLATKADGGVNLGTFNKNLKMTGETISSLSAKMSQYGVTGQTAFNSLGRQILNTRTELKKTQTVLGEMVDTMVKAARWRIAYSSIDLMTSSVRDAYKYVNELDASLNRIRIVTGDSAEKMDEFAQKANRAAKTLGASTKAYTDAALIYYEQGLSDKEVEARTNVTMKVTNVTDLNAEEAAENLTAVWNGFKIATKDSEATIDQLAAVAANSASNLGELSTAMSKVASAASTSGISTEQLTAQIATIEEATRQAPESIGTALKTVFARIGDLKADGVDEFGTKLGEVSTQLKTMGVDILDESGSMKDMGAVIEEVAGHWNNWTREQKQAAAIAMAGKRQYNNLFALFENWDRYTENLAVASDSLGTLQTQNETYLESTAGKMSQLKATTEEFYTNLINSDAIKLAIDGVKQIVGVVASLGNGPIPGIVVAMSGIGTLLNTKIAKGLSDMLVRSSEEISHLEEQKILLSTIEEIRKNIIKMPLSQDVTSINVGMIKENIGLKEQAEQRQRILELSSALTEDEHERLQAESEQIKLLKEEQAQANSDINGLTTRYKSDLSNIGGTKKQQATLNELTEQKQILSLKEDGYAIDEKELIAWSEKANKAQKVLGKLQQTNERKQKSGKLSEEELEKQNEIINKNVSRIEKIQELYQEIHSKQKNINVSSVILNQQLDEASKKKILQEGFSNLGNSLSSITFALSSISGLVSTLENPDLSTWEKFSRTMMTLSITVPMIARSVSSIAKFGKSFGTFSSILNEKVQERTSGWKLTKLIKGSGSSAIETEATKVNTRAKLDNANATKAQVDAENKLAKAKAKVITEEGIENAIEKNRKAKPGDVEFDGKFYRKGDNGWRNINGGSVIKNEELIGTLEGAGEAGEDLGEGMVEGATGTTALGLSLGELAAVAAVAVAAIAAVSFAIYTVIKAENANADSLKKATEKQKEAAKQASNFANTLKETQQNYSELSNTLTDLESKRIALSSLTEGTQEWKDAVFALNGQILDLIDKYPQLLEYLEVSENGVYKINEKGFQDFRQKQENAIKQQEAALYSAQANKYRATIEVDRNKIANTLSDAFGKSFKETSNINVRNQSDIRSQSNNQSDFTNIFKSSLFGNSERDKALDTIDKLIEEKGTNALNNEDAIKKAFEDFNLDKDNSNAVVEAIKNNADEILKFNNEKNKEEELQHDSNLKYYDSVLQSLGIINERLDPDQKGAMSEASSREWEGLQAAGFTSNNEQMSLYEFGAASSPVYLHNLAVGTTSPFSMFAGIPALQSKNTNNLNRLGNGIWSENLSDFNLYTGFDDMNDLTGGAEGKGFDAKDIRAFLKDSGEGISKETEELLSKWETEGYNLRSIYKEMYQTDKIDEEAYKKWLESIGDDQAQWRYFIQQIGMQISATQTSGINNATKNISGPYSKVLAKSGDINANELNLENYTRVDIEKSKEDFDKEYAKGDNKNKDNFKKSVKKVEELTNTFNKRLDEAKNEVLKQNPKFDENILNDLSISTINSIRDIYDNLNEEQEKSVNEILNGPDGKKYINAFGDLLNTGGSIEEFASKARDAGLEFDIVDDAMQEFVKSINEATAAYRNQTADIPKLTNALDVFKERVSSLKPGDEISQEDYNKLKEGAVSDSQREAIDKYFAPTAGNKRVFTGDNIDIVRNILLGGTNLNDIVAGSNYQQNQYEVLSRYLKNDKSDGNDFLKLLTGKDTNGNDVTSLELKNILGGDSSEMKAFKEDNKEFLSSLLKKNDSSWADLFSENEETRKKAFEIIQQFYSSGKEGKFDVNGAQLSSLYQANDGLAYMRATAAVVSDKGDVGSKMQQSAYEQAREATLATNLKALDSSLTAERAYKAEVEKSNEALQKNKVLLEEISADQFLIKTGVTALSKAWNNTYKDAEKGSKEYNEAIAQSADIMTKMFGGVKVTEDFVISHLKDVKLMANGDIKAVRRLQDALTKIQLKNLDIDDKALEDKLLRLNDLDLEVGVSLVPGDRTFDDLIEYFKNKKIPIEAQIKLLQGQGYLVNKTKNGEIKSITYEGINDKLGLTKDSALGFGNKGDTSEKEKEILDKEEYNNDIYHRINNQLEDIDRTVQRLETHQNDLWGPQALENYDKINNALDKNVNYLKQKIKLQEKDLKSQKGRLQSEFGVSFDANSRIKNYTQVYDKYYKGITSLQNKYNKMSADAQDSERGKQLKKDVDREKKKLSDFQKYVSDYENVYKDYQDNISKIDELAQKKIETEIKKIELSIEIKVDKGEFQREYQEFLRDTKYAPNDYLSMSKSELKDYKTYNDEIKTRGKRINELTKAINNFKKNGADPKFNNGFKQVKEEFQKLVKEQEDSIKKLYDIQKTMLDNLSSNFKDMISDFEEINNKYNTLSTTIKHFSEITKLVWGEEDYASQQKFFKQMDVVNRSSITSLQKQLKTQEKSLKAYQKGLKNANTPLEKYYFKNLIKDTENQIKSTKQNIQSLITETFQNLKQGYENSVKTIFKEIEKGVTSGLGFDVVLDGISKTKKYSDEWLDDVQKIYNINKLNRAFDDAAKQQTSLNIQNKILQAKREEVNLLEQQGKLQQYDIDRANLKLNILLKEIALQEARENKSKLRLRRDAQGNYSYQYTANQDDISKAQQELEDAKYQLNELDQKQRMTLTENLANIYKEWTAAQQNLSLDTTLNSNQRQQRSKQIDDYYKQELNNTIEGLSENERNLYESSLEYFNKLNKTHFEKVDEMTSEELKKFNDFIYGSEGLVPLEENGFRKMNTDADAWKLNFSNAVDGCKQKLAEYKAANEEVAKIAGSAYTKIIKGDDKDKETSGLEDVKSATNDLSKDTDKLASKYSKTETEILKTITAVDKFQKKMNLTKYENAIKENVKLANSFDKIKVKADAATKAQKKLSAASGGSSGSASGGTGGGSSNSSSKNTSPKNTNSSTTKTTSGANGRLERGDKAKWTNPDGKNHTEFHLYRDSKLKNKQNLLPYFSSDSGMLDRRLKNKYVEIVGATKDSVKIKFDYLSKTKDGSIATNVEGWISNKTFRDRFTGFDTGGYTGNWNSNQGKLALLHEKELVLNKKDTQNLLQAIEQLRDMQNTLSLNANELLNSAVKEYIANLKNINTNNSKVANQSITINADFPNATDRKEIEAAFVSLEAKATQYAWSSKLDV